MITYGNALDFERRLVRVEEQIKQFKATQNYGVDQIQYNWGNSVSANAGTWYDSYSQINIYGVHMVIEFRGDLTDRPAITTVCPYIENFSGSEDDVYWDIAMEPGDSQNIMRYEIWAQHYTRGTGNVPSGSTSFSLNVYTPSTMKGATVLVSSDVPQWRVEAA